MPRFRVSRTLSRSRLRCRSGKRQTGLRSHFQPRSVLLATLFALSVWQPVHGETVVYQGADVRGDIVYGGSSAPADDTTSIVKLTGSSLPNAEHWSVKTESPATGNSFPLRMNGVSVETSGESFTVQGLTQIELKPDIHGTSQWNTVGVTGLNLASFVADEGNVPVVTFNSTLNVVLAPTLSSDSGRVTGVSAPGGLYGLPIHGAQWRFAEDLNIDIRATTGSATGLEVAGQSLKFEKNLFITTATQQGNNTGIELSRTTEDSVGSTVNVPLLQGSATSTLRVQSTTTATTGPLYALKLSNSAGSASSTTAPYLAIDLPGENIFSAVVSESVASSRARATGLRLELNTPTAAHFGSTTLETSTIDGQGVGLELHTAQNSSSVTFGDTTVRTSSQQGSLFGITWGLQGEGTTTGTPNTLTFSSLRMNLETAAREGEAGVNAGIALFGGGTASHFILERESAITATLGQGYGILLQTSSNSNNRLDIAHLHIALQQGSATAARDTVDETVDETSDSASSEEAPLSLADLIGIYSIAYSDAHNALTFDTLQIEAQQALVATVEHRQEGVSNVITVKNLQFTGTDAEHPAVYAVGEGAQIQLQEGFLNFQGASEKLFLAEKKGHITVAPSAVVRLVGEAEANNEGWLDFTFTGPQPTGAIQLTLNNRLDIGVAVAARREVGSNDPSMGRITMTLKEGATWQGERNRVSSLDTLTLNNGVVDLSASDVTFVDERLNLDTISTNLLRYMADKKLGERWHREEIPEIWAAVDADLNRSALIVDTLEGTGGTIALRLDPSTDTSQVLTILSASAGSHQLAFTHNAAAASGSGKPILVVRSLLGASTDATDVTPYQAQFRLADAQAQRGGVEVGELLYSVKSTDDVQANPFEGAQKLTEDEAKNHKNWYLVPVAYKPKVPETPDTPGTPDTPEEPAFSTTALGVFGLAGVHYLAATDEELLRERLGNLRYLGLDGHPSGKNALWAKTSLQNSRVATFNDVNYDVQMNRLAVGADRRVGEGSLVGSYFTYRWLGSSESTPAKLNAQGFELGGYATHAWNNAFYVDLVGRLGRTEGKLSATDTLGLGVRARHADANYAALSLEVGKEVPLSGTFSLTPFAKVAYTRLSAVSANADSGLSARMDGYESLLSSVGSTVEGHVTLAGAPVTFFAKAAWEREWRATPTVTFNGGNTYELPFKASRFAYGLGAEGGFGRGHSWHVDASRTRGDVFANHWRVNAGVRFSL